MIDAMELAGTTDLRAHVDLPLALRIIGRPKDSSLRRAADQLRAWQRAGGLRQGRATRTRSTSTPPRSA